MEIRSRLAEVFPMLQRPDLEREIMEHATFITAAAGEVIIREGQYLKVLPLVISGSLRVSQQSDGREILLYYVQPGETCIMSLSSCFFNVESPSTAIADTQTGILCVPTRFIKEWQRRYDPWNEFVIRTFQSRYNELLDLFRTVAFDTIEVRVINYLKSYSSRENTRNIPITHLALANALGTTRVVISRILKRFEQEGKLQLLHGSIRITGL
ncbi:Crp/Fnr family transcriptional regulator [Mucilaginibacter ginsenosidivorans]|uniref:Crp/Fnr family transcriptional regulator n=1 Tax=Mucilaginibacter ginsenosidivorans TaxID=398053 RepID=A0A5B8UZ94_9SPHI|nr:Crp/Fnr family transcriptional regulator [Mucilaginibacter ginsenosidivorans]QEC63691.1 Crp/Fnr family transcriptional regulator [Mucilaginibacter ginsenosidivorans]